jgi:hypothetical protein
VELETINVARGSSSRTAGEPKPTPAAFSSVKLPRDKNLAYGEYNTKLIKTEPQGIGSGMIRRQSLSNVE